MKFLSVEYLGWLATTVFVASYFCRRAELLRGLQMLGALLWIVYGLQIRAVPVVIANILVFSAAAWTVLRDLPMRVAAPHSN